MSIIYFIIITFVGFVYAAAYIVGKRHRGKTFAFWSVTLSHAIHNLIVISLEFVAPE